MTIPIATARQVHVGTGVLGQAYSYSFWIFSALHLRVTHVTSAGVETVLTYSSEYDVSGVGDRENFGGVTPKGAYDPVAIDEKLVIERVVPVIQETDLRTAGNFLPQSHEDAFDYITDVLQQIESVLGTNDRSNSRVPILRTRDAVGSGGFDFLGNQGKNLADPTEAQDAVTLASLAGEDAIFDALFPRYTWATEPDPPESIPQPIIRVRDPGGPEFWRFRCQKKDGSYGWVTGPQASPF